MWSKAMQEALSAVANMGQRAKPRWQIGQPLWLFDDHRCFIVYALTRDCFGHWIVDATLEADPTGQLYYAPEDHFTDQPPGTAQLHSAHRGNNYRTRTGMPLKCIRNPYDTGAA